MATNEGSRPRKLTEALVRSGLVIVLIAGAPLIGSAQTINSVEASDFQVRKRDWTIGWAGVRFGLIETEITNSATSSVWRHTIVIVGPLRLPI